MAGPACQVYIRFMSADHAGTLGVEVDACIGEGFLDGADCLQLLLRLQDAALELGKKNAP